jgi:hypothetical protein
MRRNLSALVFAGVTQFALMCGAHADVIIDTTGAATDDLYPGPVVPLTVAQTFTAAGGSLTSFGFVLEDGGADSFTAQAFVWSTLGGVPTGMPLFTSAVINVGARVLYEFDTGGLAITFGDTYAVGFSWLPGSDSSVPGSDIVRGNGLGGLDGNLYASFSGGTPTSPLTQDIGIRVVMVPEPGTLALLGIAAAALAWRRRTGSE